MGRLFKLQGFLAYTSMIFLNAFVDLGHKIVIQNTVLKIYDGQTQIILIAIVNALILMPFILLFSPAGFLSDKYPKNIVMRLSAWAAVVCTILITLFYYLGWFWPAFTMTFLLAMQSAFYSPAKYGYIKELVGKDKLTVANGVVQATTTIAILSGIFVYSILFEQCLSGVDYASKSDVLKAIAPLGWFLILNALIELGTSYMLPQKQAVDESMSFDIEQYKSGSYLRNNLNTVLKHEIILLSIIGLSIFWGISQVMIAAFPVYAEETMLMSNTAVIQGMMACAGIGIMIGSLIAGRISKNHIETGMIPIGSFGVAATLMILPSLESTTLLILNFIALGMFGGLFIIPLNALIQFHAGEHKLGRVLAANNLIQNVVMLSFLGLTVVFAYFGIGSTGLFAILSIVAVGGALFTIYKLPQSMMRFIVSFVIGRKYSLEVLGLKHMPESGGVLLLGNHISWIDWAIVQMASPRPVRFVMERSIYERWYLKRFLDFFGVVPISRGSSKTALSSITQLLNEGEVVCLFPEGTISRSGQLAEFQRGYEKAAAEASGIILPFYLRGLWGSWFSRSSDKLKSIRGNGVKRDIIVSFGAPLPIDTSVENLKKHIFELSVDSWERYTQTLGSLPHEWLATVKRMASEPAVVDTLGDPLSFNKFAAVTICFARLFQKNSPEQNIGLLLPTTSAGVIANMATLLCGKTVVNLNFSASIDTLKAATKKAGLNSIYTSRKFLQKLEKKGIELDSVFEGINIYYMEDLKTQINPTRVIVNLLCIRILPAWILKRLFSKPVSLDDTAAILFSSGSEGEPKGVMLTHRNIMANLKQISDVLNTEDSDVIMATLPLFHAFGLTVTTFMPLIEGIPIVCHPDPTDAVNIAKAITKYRATIFCGTSTFLRLYIKNNRVHPLMLASLRIVVAGAEKLSPDVREAFKLKFNKDIYEGYGATETTPVASVNIPDQLDSNHWRVQLGSKLGTVGMPLPGTSFRIVDPDSLQELPVNEDGLILIGGSQVMLGYLDDKAKTDEVIVMLDDKRWYKTGDKGHLDENGFLTIVDRYSRFAKVGGEMISLTSVEEKIRHVLGKPELELVAMNVPDKNKGEKIVLLLAEETSIDELRKSLLDDNTSPLMIPSEIVIDPNIPILGSGKTDFKAARKLILNAIQ
jgi:acyl-[acyl-carrier-protein]-phospholipid O-acyltransferase / long-chain-fatty-acid--[acyl-carrier-protein] ligase